MQLIISDRKPEVSGKQVYIGDAVQVNDTSTKGTGTLSTIKVKWGDGTVETIAPGGSAIHVYSAKGTVTLKLVAIDSDGLKSSVSKQIKVINPPAP
jgi:PKD repeat protein